VAQHCGPKCGHVHFSTLKLMAKSPAHYHHAYENGTNSNAAMNLGTAIHSYVFEKGAGVVTFPGKDRRAKEWAPFKSANASKTIITLEEAVEVQAILASLKKHERAMELLTGATETSFGWEIAGRACRGTTDVFVNHGINRVVDLKSTTDAHPYRFQRTAERLGYFAQLPWYMTGARQAGLGDFDEAFIVAVETKPPYVVQTFQVAPHALELGERMWRAWFERLLVCEASNAWPGYQETDALLDMPEDLALTMGGEPLEIE
jgi:exodeoxyribonuclease VIII